MIEMEELDLSMLYEAYYAKLTNADTSFVRHLDM